MAQVDIPAAAFGVQIRQDVGLNSMLDGLVLVIHTYTRKRAYPHFSIPSSIKKLTVAERSQTFRKQVVRRSYLVQPVLITVRRQIIVVVEVEENMRIIPK